MSARPDLKPWERQPKESSKAYEAFVVYRDLGAERTLAAAARQLGKNYSLIRRWADRHYWQERVYAWDRTHARADEAATRQQRDDMVRRQMQDADRLQRLAMAKITSLVSRDPQTGELTLDTAVTPQQAVSLYHLSLRIQRQTSEVEGESESSGAGESPEAELRGLSTAELTQLIDLARERAGTSQTDGGEADDGD